MLMRSHLPDLFFSEALPALEELAYMRYEQMPDVIPQLFDVRKIDREMIQYSSLSDLPAAQQTQENEDTPYVDINPGFNKTYVVNTYKLGFQVSEEMVEDQKHSEMEKLHKGLGRSHFQTRQVLAAKLFNDGFTVNGYDGVPLFSEVHPLLEGGTTQNEEATPLNLGRDSLRAAIKRLEGTLDEQGYPVLMFGKKILINPADEFVANELIQSPGDSESAYLKANVFKSKNLQVISWAYLTDANAWFLGADTSECGLKFIERVPFSVEAGRDFDSGGFKTKSRQRFVVDFDAWRGWWGSSGTT